MENDPVHIGHDGRRFTIDGFALNDPIWISFPEALTAEQRERLRAALENGEVYRRIREEFAREYRGVQNAGRPLLAECVGRMEFVTGMQNCTRRALGAAGEDLRREQGAWWRRAAAWFSDPLSGWRP